MSEALVRQALEVRLAAIASPLPTAWENADFTPPADGAAWQRVDLLRAEPENPEFGPMKRLLGVLQVTLFYPASDGPGDADAKAVAIADWFKRGTTLAQGGVTVTIDKTPYVMPGFRDGNSWAVPVRIPYYSNISV